MNAHDPTILVVDATLYWTQALARYLPNTYTIRTAKNGLLALQLLDAHPCNVIVTEYHLPEIHGGAFVDIVKSQERFKTLPIIMYTNAHHDDIEVVTTERLQAVFPKINTHFQDLAYAVYSLIP